MTQEPWLVNHAKLLFRGFHPVAWISNVFRNHQLSYISMSTVERCRSEAFTFSIGTLILQSFVQQFQRFQRTSGVLLPACYPSLGMAKVYSIITFYKNIGLYFPTVFPHKKVIYYAAY